MPTIRDRFSHAIQALKGRLEPSPEEAEGVAIEPMVGQSWFTKDLEVFNPDALISRKRLSVIDEMMRDDQVKASMTLKQQAPISGEWSVVPASDNPRHILHADFIRDNFKGLRGTFKDCLYAITDALPYGFSVQEKVLEKMTGGTWRGKMMMKRTIHHSPHNLAWIWDDDEKEMVGVEQLTSGQTIPNWKAVIYRWNPKWNNPWGMTDLDGAYRAWFSKDWTIRHWNIHMERVALQRLVATYQDGFSTMSNDMVDQWVEAIGISKPEGVDIEFMGGGSDAKASSDTFEKAIQVHDQAITRSILKQTLATQEGARVGSMALGKVHQDTLAMELDNLQLDIEEVVNEQLIRFLIDLNFGVQDAYPSFHLPDLFPEDPKDYVEAYTNLLKEGGIVITKADEDRVREVVGLPVREGEDAPSGKAAGGGGGTFPFEHEDHKEHFSQPAKRAGIKEIGRSRDSLEKIAIGQFTDIMDRMEERLLKSVRNKFFREGLANASEIRKIEVGFIGQIRSMMTHFGQELAEQGAQDLRESVGRAEGFAAVNPGGLTMKQQMAALKKNLSAKGVGIASDVKFEIERDVRNVLLKALQNGETQAETTKKLQQLFEKWQVGSTLPGGELSPWRIETIIRTNFTDAYSQGRLIAARDPDLADFIQAFQYVAILDERTSEICEALDGLVLAANDPAIDTIVPPNHFNCRSVLVEVIKDEKFKNKAGKSNTPDTASKVSSGVDTIPSSFK